MKRTRTSRAEIGFKPCNNEQFMMPSDLRDWLPKNHPACILDEIVDCLDLSEIRKAYSPIGQRAYSPNMMVKVWLYGYMTRARSCRELARKIETDVAFMYLAGMQRPGFRSLDRFRVAHQEALKRLFAEVVHLCAAAGMVSLAQVSGDGTKLKANASAKRSRTPEQIQAEIDKAQAQFDEISEKIRQQDESDARQYGKDHRGDELLEELADRDKRLEFFKKKKQEIESGALKKINITDSDATFQKIGQVIKPGYNAQVIVEDSNQIILSQDVVQNAHDSAQLKPGLEQLKENLGAYPDRANYDGAYHSGHNLQLAETLGVDLYTPDPETRKQNLLPELKRPFHRNEFTYDPIENLYVCPKGKVLSRYKTDWVDNNDHSKGRITAYRGKSCELCEAFHICRHSPDAKARMVYRDDFESLREKHRAKMNKPESQKIYESRRSTVEPVFGNLKHNLGYRHFLLRGLSKVRTEFTFMAIAHNLQKLAAKAVSKGVPWLQSVLASFRPLQTV